MRSNKLKLFDSGQYRVGTKIMAVVGVLAIAAAAIAAGGAWSLNRVSTAAERINLTAVEAKLGARMNQDIVELNRAEYRVAVDPDAVDDVRAEVDARQAAFEERLAAARDKASGKQAAMLARVA
jgi:methyl-accepting chemotaxis protein